MTLNELIAWCNVHGVSGDLELAVHAFGGIGGAGQPIEKASLGFDWDKGKLMLHTKRALMLFPEKPREKVKRPAKQKKRSQPRKPGPSAWPLKEQPTTPPTALLLPKMEVKETGEAGITRPRQKGKHA